MRQARYAAIGAVSGYVLMIELLEFLEFGTRTMDPEAQNPESAELGPELPVRDDALLPPNLGFVVPNCQLANSMLIGCTNTCVAPQMQMQMNAANAM